MSGRPIHQFQSDVKDCVKKSFVKSHYSVTDFREGSDGNSLDFTWISSVSNRKCSCSYTAGEKYPDAGVIKYCWNDSGFQNSRYSSSPLESLIWDIGEELEFQHSMANITDKQGGKEVDISQMLLDSLAKDDEKERQEAAADEESPDEESPDEESPDEEEVYELDIDYDFNDYYEGFDDNDYLDEDPATYDRESLGDGEEDEKTDLHLHALHPKLREDVLTFRRLLEPEGAPQMRRELESGHCSTDATAKPNVVPLLYVRPLGRLREVDIDMHVPLTDLGISGFHDQHFPVEPERTLRDKAAKKLVGAVIGETLEGTGRVTVRGIQQCARWSLGSSWCLVFSCVVTLQEVHLTHPDLRAAQFLYRLHAGGEPKDDVDTGALQTLLEMGFPELESRQALKNTLNDVADASMLLICQNKQQLEGACSLPPSHQKEDGTSADRDVQKMPSLADGFLVMIYRYIRQRLPSINDYCVICDDRHHIRGSVSMLKPSVCLRSLCQFSFQTFGVMGNALVGIASEVQVIDLLVKLAKVACRSHRKHHIFNPYPNILDPTCQESSKWALTDKNKDYPKVKRLLEALPPLSSLLIGSGHTDLWEKLNRRDPLLYPLMSWIVSSNRSHIIKLPEENFILLSSPPKEEMIFREAKKKHGSCFAFHGSPIENWHSIIRNGLVVASGTHLQLHGPSEDHGIYLSPAAEISRRYARLDNRCDAFRASRRQRRRRRKRLSCLALCEVINSPEALKKMENLEWVCSEAHYVCTRFLFVFEEEKSVFFNFDVDNPEFKKQLEKALNDRNLAVENSS